MQKLVLTCVVGVFLGAGASADTGLQALAGRWRNIDVKTRGITTVEIRVDRAVVTVHVWGSCAPKDCDLGERPATAYADSVDAKAVDAAKALVVEMGANMFLVLRPAAQGQLTCESFNKFTDGSGRTNVVATDVLRLSPLSPVRK